MQNGVRVDNQSLTYGSSASAPISALWKASKIVEGRQGVYYDDGFQGAQ